ncbi:4-fold beta flower protein [Lentisalinibacter sediminis]|uniref:4-fold beta flower protein n=1 Tax=Lentisalinibacter sediminis TaxID=2992237 RepID=UPI0038673006
MRDLWAPLSGRREYTLVDTLYNSSGRAIAYIDDDSQSIYLYSGKPVAWISDDAVYAYSGR